jgi:hypothetical protein
MPLRVKVLQPPRVNGDRPDTSFKIRETKTFKPAEDIEGENSASWYG